MKKLLKLLLLPALCAFFLLQAQQVAAQSKDNDVLVMEFGNLHSTTTTAYGIYVFWPDKELEFTALQRSTKLEEVVAIKKTVFKKINELADLGWELDIVENNIGNSIYYFKRATPK